MRFRRRDMQPAVNLRLHLRGLVTTIRRILAVSIGREAGLAVMSRHREHCRRSRQANISHIPVQLPLSVLASSFGYIHGCRKIARCQNKGRMQSTASHPLRVSHGRVAVAMHMVTAGIESWWFSASWSVSRRRQRRLRTSPGQRASTSTRPERATLRCQHPLCN